MVEVIVEGSVYCGRLTSLVPHTEGFTSPDGKTYWKNYGYHLEIMDANGVILQIELKELSQITVVG